MEATLSTLKTTLKQVKRRAFYHKFTTFIHIL